MHTICKEFLYISISDHRRRLCPLDHPYFVFTLIQAPVFVVQLFSHAFELPIAWLKHINSIGLDLELNGYWSRSLATHLWYYIRQICVNNDWIAAYICVDLEDYEYLCICIYVAKHIDVYFIWSERSISKIIITLHIICCPQTWSNVRTKYPWLVSLNQFDSSCLVWI